MRLIWQGIWLVVLAMVCFVASGVEYYTELSFGGRAVEVTARVIDRHSYTRTTGSGHFGQAHYSVRLAFDLQGRHHEVSQRVSMVSYLQSGIGDPVTIQVDPDAPSVIERNGDEFASMGLFLAFAGFAAGALSVLSFGTAWSGLKQRAGLNL